jgi:hypothetical protein
VYVHFGKAAWVPMGTPVTGIKSFIDGDTNLVVHEIQDHDDNYDNI